MSMETAPLPQLLTLESESVQSFSSSMENNNRESAPLPHLSTSEVEPVQSSNISMVDSNMEPAMPPNVSTVEVEPVQSSISYMVDSFMEPAQSVYFSVADIASVSKSPWRMKWFMALHEEDCLKIRELLHKDPRLVIVHPEEAERRTLDRITFGWRGCTALHVAVKKGWSILVEEILDKFECRNAGPEGAITDEKSKGSWDPSIELMDLLLAFDSDCQMDALAIAIASFNTKIISLLTDAFRKCKYDGPYRLKDRRRFNLMDLSCFDLWCWFDVWNEEMVKDREVVGEFASHVKNPDGEQIQEIAKTFVVSLIPNKEILERPIDGMVAVAANELRHRKLLLEVTSKFMEANGRKRLTEFFETHTDFNFLPIEIYLFHALCASKEFEQELWQLGERIFLERNSLLLYVFELRDAQGRTPMHVAVEYDNFFSLLKVNLEPQSEAESGREISALQLRLSRRALPDPANTATALNRLCAVARDSVGRTALHRVIMLEKSVSIDEDLFFGEGLGNTEDWRPPLESQFCHFYEKVLIRNGSLHSDRVYHISERVHTDELAYVCANVPILQKLLEHENSGEISDVMQMIAARSGDAIQFAALRDTGKFDARVEDEYGNNLLHLALKPSSGYGEEWIHVTHFRPLNFNKLRSSVEVFNCRVSDRNRVRRSQVSQSVTSSVQSDKGRQACINLLLEAGVDAFHRNDKGLLPNVGPEASPEMRLWWSERLAKVTQEMSGSLALAANAISVTAALVATASFIGPLQPPLGYGTDSAGINEHMQLEVSTVRVFFISNTLAFYLALGAIMLSLIPALPFPNESMEDERKRSRLTVVTATSLLMASMVLILVAFTTASTAVSSNGGSWNHGGFTKPLFIGGGVLSLLISWWCSGRIFQLVSLIYKASLFRGLPTVFLGMFRPTLEYYGRHSVIDFFIIVAMVFFLFIYGLLSLLWLLLMVGFNLLDYREIYRNPSSLIKNTLWVEVLRW